MNRRQKEELLLEVASRIAAGAVAHAGVSKVLPDVIATYSIQIASELIKQTSGEVSPKPAKKAAKLFDRKTGKAAQ